MYLDILQKVTPCRKKFSKKVDDFIILAVPRLDSFNFVV